MFGFAEILGQVALQKSRNTCMAAHGVEYSIPLRGRDIEFDVMVDAIRAHLIQQQIEKSSKPNNLLIPFHPAFM